MISLHKSSVLIYDSTTLHGARTRVYWHDGDRYSIIQTGICARCGMELDGNGIDRDGERVCIITDPETGETDWDTPHQPALI